MADKRSFILYMDLLQSAVDTLSDEELGQLLRAIHAYHEGCVYDPPSKNVSLVFTFFRASFVRSDEKYQKIVERRREAGSKHKGNQYTRAKQLEQMFQNGTDSDSVSGSDNVSVSDVSTETVIEDQAEEPHKTQSRFIPPTLQEVQQYTDEKYPSTPQSVIEDFWNYYESNGWHVGKNVMKKWHNALSRWISNSQKTNSNAGYSNPYQRRIQAEQQLGHALAQQCVNEIAAENNGEGRHVPFRISQGKS